MTISSTPATPTSDVPDPNLSQAQNQGQIQTLRTDRQQSLDAIATTTDPVELQKLTTKITSDNKSLLALYDQAANSPALKSSTGNGNPPSNAALAAFLDVSYAVTLVQAYQQTVDMDQKAMLMNAIQEMAQNLQQSIERLGEETDTIDKANTQAAQTREGGIEGLVTAAAQLTVAVAGNFRLKEEPVDATERVNMSKADPKTYPTPEDTPATRSAPLINPNLQGTLGQALGSLGAAVKALAIDAPAIEKIGTIDADMIARRARNDAAKSTKDAYAQQIQQFDQQVADLMRSLTDMTSKLRQSINWNGV